MRTSILTGLTALLLAGAALAAPVGAPGTTPVTFTGRVTDEAGAPLPGARVALDGTSHVTVTRTDGTYLLSVPRAELGTRALLRVTRIGYEPATLRVEVDREVIRRDVRLRPAAVSLDELVVTGAAARDASAERTRAEPAPSAPPPPPAAAAMHPHPYHAPGWNTEEYDHRVDNEFIAVAHRPLSTFSVDVDRASYANVRRFLLEGQRPPEDAVRIEEMINYFPYSYPEPRPGEPFSLTVETAPAPWRPEHHLVRIGLRTAAVDLEEAPPSNLVFLIDVSGSMAGPDRLPLVKRSLRLLVDQLRPTDRVAMVVYAGAAGLVLPSTPGSHRQTILDAIERLEAGGSTAGGAGLRLAYDVAREHHLRGGNNRVILATDGDFNVGPSSTGEMVRLIEERRAQGTHLTVLGFGRGNLNDAMMQQIAQHGNGNYAYIDSLLEARKALVDEMGGTLRTVASDVKLQVEFNPSQVQAYRLIGYENRLLADEDFNDDSVDAGDVGAGHTVTALYEVVPAGADGAVTRTVDPRRYGRPGGLDGLPSPGPAERSSEMAYVKVRYKAPNESRSRLMERPVLATDRRPSADFAFAAAVAGFGMILRDSPHRGELGVLDVVRLARAGRGDDSQGHRAEFIRLVELYGGMRADDDR